MHLAACTEVSVSGTDSPAWLSRIAVAWDLAGARHAGVGTDAVTEADGLMGWDIALPASSSGQERDGMDLSWLDAGNAALIFDNPVLRDLCYSSSYSVNGETYGIHVASDSAAYTQHAAEWLAWIGVYWQGTAGARECSNFEGYCMRKFMKVHHGHVAIGSMRDVYISRERMQAYSEVQPCQRELDLFATGCF